MVRSASPAAVLAFWMLGFPGPRIFRVRLVAAVRQNVVPEQFHIFAIA
jgi:hypothetical protein